MKRIKTPKPAQVEQDAHAEALADAVTGRYKSISAKKGSPLGTTDNLKDAVVCDPGILADLKLSQRHVLRARGDLALPIPGNDEKGGKP